MLGPGGGALADKVVGGEGLTGGANGLPAEGKRGPPCIAPHPNAGGPLLSGSEVLEGGPTGPDAEGEDPKGLRPGDGGLAPKLLAEEGTDPGGGGLAPNGGGG